MPIEIQPTKTAKDIKSTVVEMITNGNVEDAINLFENHSEEVNVAISEYRTDMHSIMKRPEKLRKDKSSYDTHRLPRNWQYVINEVELYFLMNNGLKWELLNDDADNEKIQKAFERFNKFLHETHYDSSNRQMKRLAGAETECAKLYAYYKDENEAKVKIVVLSKSLGYELRPLFNRYGDMKAFAVGFKIKDAEGNVIQEWDIYTSETIYRCTQNVVDTENQGYKIEQEQNALHKIPIIYARQPKAWEGVQERIERDEWLDSKNADCNEYFADPMLKISKTVKNGLADPKAVGKVIQVGTKDDVFEYVTPPDATDMKSNEKTILKESILNGSFTPDFSYENVKGLGAISGEAITKANVLGYIKRLSRMEIYDEIFERDANLIKEILGRIIDPQNLKDYQSLQLQHVYQDPSIGMSDNSEEIARWAEIGMSDEAIVEANRNISNKKRELMRLKKKREEAQNAAVEAAKASTNNNNKNE